MSLNLGDDRAGNTATVERQEISQMVKCRMSSLGLPLEDYGMASLRPNLNIYYLLLGKIW